MSVPTACAVAQHHDAVGNGKNLLEPMTDVNDAQPLAFKVANDLEQPLDFLRRQSGAGLVHDQDAGVGRQGLGDLDDLLLGHREIAAKAVGVDGHADAAKQLPGLGLFLAVPQPTPGARSPGRGRCCAAADSAGTRLNS